jgi:hypothetical protein
MIFKDPGGDEPLLGPMEHDQKSGSNGRNDGLSNDTIIRVGHRDRSSILGEEGARLRDEEEETIIKAIRRENPVHEAGHDQKEDWGPEPGRRTPGGKGDAVRTGNRVIGLEDGILHVPHPRPDRGEPNRDVELISPKVDVRGDRLLRQDPAAPDLGPAGGSNASHLLRVRGGGIFQLGPKGVKPGPRGGEGELDLIKRCGLPGGGGPGFTSLGLEMPP